MSRKLMSITEGAKYLKIPRSRLHREVRSGKIPSTRIGWNYILKTSDLDDYRNSNGHNHK